MKPTYLNAERLKGELFFSILLIHLHGDQVHKVKGKIIDAILFQLFHLNTDCLSEVTEPEVLQ